MPKFEVQEIKFPSPAEQNFYQLIAESTDNNGRRAGVLDLFERDLEKKNKKDLEMIYAYMNMVANGEHIPGTKYHILERDKNDPYQDFEFKHGKLRVYGIKIPAGKLVVLGSYKSQEKRSIKQLRSFKKQYFKTNLYE